MCFYQLLYSLDSTSQLNLKRVSPPLSYKRSLTIKSVSSVTHRHTTATISQPTPESMVGYVFNTYHMCYVLPSSIVLNPSKYFQNLSNPPLPSSKPFLLTTLSFPWFLALIGSGSLTRSECRKSCRSHRLQVRPAAPFSSNIDNESTVEHQVST